MLLMQEGKPYTKSTYRITNALSLSKTEFSESDVVFQSLVKHLFGPFPSFHLCSSVLPWRRVLSLVLDLAMLTSLGRVWPPSDRSQSKHPLAVVSIVPGEGTSGHLRT
jgi:hypothetical protein